LVIRVSIIMFSSRTSKPISAGPGFRLHRPAREGETTDRPGTRSEKGWGDLLAAAQRGDSAVYRAFLEAVLPFLRSVARARSWSAQDAEDVVQDALLTLHRVRHTYQQGRPVKPWLAAIVVRRAIDANRRLGRTAAREVHDPVAHETFAAEPANRDEAADAAVRLGRMMEGLTPKQKEVLDLVKLREMSLAEASAASGQSIASLKVNIHRAIRKMRLGLGGKDSE
jgi:RNA polymerase sigma factor (sigma-70 family)